MYIETTGAGSTREFKTRVRRTGIDSDLIVVEKVGNNITYCRDRYPLNVWVEDHFVNIPWFMRQPGFDIEIDIGRKR
jgi:hypothetical protein